MRRICSLFFIVFMALFSAPAMGSIIKKPPAKPTETLYKDLVCTPQDGANIYEIISTMAEKGKLGLLFQQNHLRELGAQIHHVHPLAFLAVIFKDKYLKSCMYYIWDDYFKRNGFLDGLAPSLTREAEKGKLDQYIPDFAADIGSSPEALKSYFDARDWEKIGPFPDSFIGNMEVQIADSEDPYYLYKALSPEPQSWEIIGGAGLVACSMFAVAAFVPAVWAKKRVYTVIQTGGAVAVVEETVPVAEENNPPVPHTDKESDIKELFTSIADGGSDLAWPWVAYRLIQLGNAIHDVHPFSLLIAMPKEKMRQILLSGSALKIGRVIGGISEGMQREIGRNNVNRYVPSFAAAMEKQEDLIRQLIRAADWLAFAQYLFDIPAAHAQ